MDPDSPIPCVFTGFHLRHEQGILIQDQHAYLSKLEELQPNSPLSTFRSMRMRLAWLSHTRPDCLFEISQLAQVTKDMFLKNPELWNKRVSRAVIYAKRHRLSLRFPKLDPSSLRLIGYSDASFANNEDLTSQLGHICLLGDATGTILPLSFRSYKAKRVTRSVLAGEVIAFSDLFDVAATLAMELKALLHVSIPVQLFTDSKCLFDIISKGSRTSEKRLMLDVAAAREGFQSKLISDIGFVRSSHNLADGLTKPIQQSALQTALSTSTLAVQSEQWIVRK